MSNTWIDVTQELTGLSQRMICHYEELNFLDIVKHSDLTLEETMHAH